MVTYRPILASGEVYHVFNRGIDHRPTFNDKRECERALITIKYYQHDKPPVKLSQYLNKSLEDQQEIISAMQITSKKLVEIYCYCVMPNHFHFLLKQNNEKGIARFLSNFQNSFTRYANTKNNRVGGLFLDWFKAVRIETDKQLLHVSRYIHLNPYTSYVVRNLKDLENYRWSSLREYLSQGDEKVCQTKPILDFFENENDYLKFIYNHAEYQRELDKIKHLLLEE